MSTFAYRILPPRARFVATISDEERTIMGRHFGYLTALREAGQIVFVGRTDGGEYGIAVIEATDLAAAEAVAAADPAVSSGLMRSEVYPFQVVFEGRGLAVTRP